MELISYRDLYEPTIPMSLEEYQADPTAAYRSLDPDLQNPQFEFQVYWHYLRLLSLKQNADFIDEIKSIHQALSDPDFEATMDYKYSENIDDLYAILVIELKVASDRNWNKIRYGFLIDFDPDQIVEIIPKIKSEMMWPGEPSSRGRIKLINKTNMNISKQNIKKWQAKTPAAFFQWLKDVKPRIHHRNGQYKIYQPTKSQEKSINNILASKNGKFVRSMSIEIQPRRHGKSTVNLLIALWLFVSRRNYTIQLLGTTETHCRRVLLNTLIKIIANTPVLAEAIPEDNIRRFEIRFPAGNVIQMSAQNAAASFGDRLNLLICSDQHATADLDPFNSLQASLLDSEDSICLIDTNVDHTDGHVHSLQREAETDPTIYCNHVHYENLEDYSKRAPAWIDRQKASRLQRTTLPADFARDILGKRMDAKNALFPSEVIELCKSSYKSPVADINELTKGRAYKVGAGLDRSKSLFQGKTGDATVWKTILKVASPEHGEPEFNILNQQKINPNTSRSIKKAILTDHERYKLDNVVLENYEVTDLSPWLTDQRIPHELVSAHDTNQNASFPEFYRIAKEGRLHFSESLKDLESEMRTFSYTQRAGGKYSFGHSSQRFKDDHPFSVNWAIFATRSEVLSAYVLGNFQCNNRSPKRNYCFLMGGSLELNCRFQCYAYERVHTMREEYQQLQLDSDLSISDFFYSHVKQRGAKVQQAV